MLPHTAQTIACPPASPWPQAEHGDCTHGVPSGSVTNTASDFQSTPSRTQWQSGHWTGVAGRAVRLNTSFSPSFARPAGKLAGQMAGRSVHTLLTPPRPLPASPTVQGSDRGRHSHRHQLGLHTNLLCKSPTGRVTSLHMTSKERLSDGASSR